MNRDYLLSDYKFSFEPVFLSSEYASKNRRQRFLYKNNLTIFNVSEVLSLSEFETFETWVQGTLNFGANSFTGQYWDCDTVRSGTLTLVDGKYDYVHLGNEVVKVSYQLELKDRSLDDGGNIYGWLTDTVPFTSEYFNEYERLVNLNNFA